MSTTKNDTAVDKNNDKDNTSHMESEQMTLWQYAFRDICLVALWLPLGGLIFCFVTASIFQQDDIHETHCRVYNIIPSISAVTGISPQRYLWRICVALHLGPRFLIGSLYYTYHMQTFHFIVDPVLRAKVHKLVHATYWLNVIEVCSLTGVTYVSNRENYPVHEKIFIVFMITSLLHMWCRATLGDIVPEGRKPLNGNHIVWILLYVSLISMCGIVIFFLLHRLLCRPLAFSWFSFCEYVLACANMAFHATVMQDFPNLKIQIAHQNIEHKTK